MAGQDPPYERGAFLSIPAALEEAVGHFGHDPVEPHDDAGLVKAP